MESLPTDLGNLGPSDWTIRGVSRVQNSDIGAIAPWDNRGNHRSDSIPPGIEMNRAQFAQVVQQSELFGPRRHPPRVSHRSIPVRREGGTFRQLPRQWPCLLRHDRWVDRSATEQLVQRLAPLAESSEGFIVLERVARGGGATRWYFCEGVSELPAVLAELRPGSRVGFFFDHRIRRQPFTDEVEAELFDIAATTGEVLLGRERTDGPELHMDFLEASDIAEAVVALRPGDPVYYGVFPAIEDDGLSCIAFTPPDEDGSTRPQPV
jgi:hypothetical protein